MSYTVTAIGSGYLETEIKLPVESAAKMRSRLRRLGFHRSTARFFEQNTVWDTPRGTLRKQGKLLRLRQLGRKTILTVKGPRRQGKTFRVRPEWEIEISSARDGAIVLTQLGYRPVFRYEKYRTVFARLAKHGPAGAVLLDETPIGVYLELEGPRGWIRRVARELGYSPANFIADSYAALYSRWRRRHRRSSPHMVF